MSQVTTTSYFHRFTKKIQQKIQFPKAYGKFSDDAYSNSSMRLIKIVEGSVQEGLYLEIYIVVDEEDGVIADFKYQCFGPVILIAALETLFELCIRKNYLQASRITYELIDRHLREDFEKVSIPIECFTYVNFCVAALHQLLDQCDDIPIPESEVPPNSPIDIEASLSIGYPNFLELSQQEKQSICEQIVQQDIRPYVQLDEGNVKIQKIEGYKITILYEGSCTTCFSATGSTLNAIQQILRAKVNPNIQVVPDLSNLGGSC